MNRSNYLNFKLMKSIFLPMVLLLTGTQSLESCNTSNKNTTMEQTSDQNKTNLLKAVSENNTEKIAKILETKPDLEIKDK